MTATAISPNPPPPHPASDHLHLYQQKDLNVPIGLSGAYLDGTPVEAWTDVQTLQADPDYKSILNRGAAYPGQYSKLLAQYEAALEKWKEADEKAKVEKQPSPKAPRKLAEPGKHPHLPTVLFNKEGLPAGPFRSDDWPGKTANAR